MADLAGHRAIYYLNRGVADWRFIDVRADEFVRPVAALRVNNGDMMLDAALSDLGLAMLPTFIAGAALRAGSLVRVEVGQAAAPESIYVAHTEGRRASAKLRALVDCLRLAFGNPPYWDAVD